MTDARPRSAEGRRGFVPEEEPPQAGRGGAGCARARLRERRGVPFGGARTRARLTKETAGPFPAASRPQPPLRVCDSLALVVAEGPAGKRRCEPIQQARPPVPTAALYLFISVDKAESSILKTKIFPGSLYLLIFQFLAAAFSAAVGGGSSSRLPERVEPAAAAAAAAVPAAEGRGQPRGLPDIHTHSPPP